MAKRRTLYVLLSLLGVFLLGTVVVLSSVSYYLAIDPSAYLTEDDVPNLGNVTRWNATEHGKIQRIPKIIHQTWKTDTLPERWKPVSQGCRDMMPDYEYILWTDASSREFIAEHYPWFLSTFDGYKYPIQRADAIRYFVLHRYGGIYVDLDIGCLRRLDPLLVYPVILPITIPVGVSNDLMFAEKMHPFFEQAIHHLSTFDHSWVLNYPTVMFSTGPMFLSAQYGLYVASHPHVTPPEVRVLPKSLYGKNAKEGEAPHSFFVHFYGSSWHADDAAFVGFLAHWGKGLMWLGLLVLVIGVLRLAFSGTKQRPYSLRRIGGYDVLLPRWTQRQGRWILDLGWFTIPGNASQLPSPVDHPGSSIHENDDDDMSYLPFDATRVSPPASSDLSQTLIHSAVTPPHPLVDAMRRARNRFVASVGVTPERTDVPRTPTRHRRFSSARGVLFFLPAFWTQSQDIELASTHHYPRPTHPDTPFHHTVSRASQLPPEKQRYAADLERAGLLGDAYTAEFWEDRGDSNRPPAPAPPVRDLIDTTDSRILGGTPRIS